MSVAWSFAREDTLSTLPRIAQLLVFILLVWEFAVTYKDQMWVLRSFLVGMLVPLAMAFAEFRGASRFEAEAGERFTGGGADLNYLAYMCSVSILIAVYLATNASALDRYCRWLYWGMAILCALECMLTGSRGGFVCLLVAAVFAMILAGVSRRRILTILQVLAAGLVVFVLVYYLVPAALLNRVTREQSIAEDPRFGIWMRGLAALWKDPLLGPGSRRLCASDEHPWRESGRGAQHVPLRAGGTGRRRPGPLPVVYGYAVWRRMAAAPARETALVGGLGGLVLQRQFGRFADRQIQLVRTRDGPGAGSGLHATPPCKRTSPFSQSEHAHRPRAKAAAAG